MSLINCDNKYVIDTDTINFSIDPVSTNVEYIDKTADPVKVKSYVSESQPIVSCEYYVPGWEDCRHTMTVKLEPTGSLKYEYDEALDRMMITSYDVINTETYTPDKVLSELKSAIEKQLDSSKKKDKVDSDDIKFKYHMSQVIKELQK